VGSCKCGDEPSGSINCGNFLSSLGPVSFSGRTLLHGIGLVIGVLLKIPIYRSTLTQLNKKYIISILLFFSTEREDSCGNYLSALHQINFV
jgi:hypothetical protein